MLKAIGSASRLGMLEDLRKLTLGGIGLTGVRMYVRFNEDSYSMVENVDQNIGMLIIVAFAVRAIVKRDGLDRCWCPNVLP